ncbi:MAG: PD-(D/E)XK nuclease family protein [Dysgonamonadaceae bacterium]|nr:PD-(D/E)XK nuclease family protein [Dysgonamonadaceae bacterium]
MTDTDSYSFLSLVAKDLVSRFGTRLADITVVFPSRRARLFFNNYLYAEVGSPLWAPQYTTVEELFESRSVYRNADMLQLTGDLYQAYLAVRSAKSEIPSTETLDEFFFFGEILLNDFDDIDKNLINARALFSNLKDLDQLKDDFSHLSEAQLESINRHFGKIFKEDTPLKTAFWSVWNILGDVYQIFREKLKERKMAYPGMLMRDVIENETIEFPGKQYVFAGFNILNRCEQSLFQRLKNKSLFYWDYDAYYLNHEAGRYIADNVRRFGSALDKVEFNSFLGGKKEITFMASSSESGQSGVIPSWIDSLNHPPDYTAPDSAIVLCNEDILPVVMHTISPEKIENVNITMGFPIMQTPIAVFLQIWAELQTKGLVKPNAFHYKQVLPALRHPYTRIIFPEAEEIEKTISRNNIFFPNSQLLNNESLFRHTSNAVELAGYLLNLVENLGKAYKNEASYRDIYDGLYQESIFRAYQVLNRLYGLLSSGEWTLEKPTFLRLLRRLLSATQVPFHGEPVKGLQIMGVLETRTLDFKNLLILSVNEGFMPGSNSENTFIPQFLRSHLGLNTINRQDSIYAYHFYRLLQRAEKITLVYNTDKTQTGKAEMSRFLLQMLVDSRLDIRRYTLLSTVKPMDVQPITVQKTDEIIRLVKEKYDFNTNPEAKPLTPSSLNTFIDCPLRFYLEKIKGYEAPDELSDELDASVFGTIFHRSAEFLYREISGTRTEAPFVVQKEHLDVYLQPGSEFRIRKLVSKAFEEVYFKRKPVDETHYNGEQLINFRVICKMLERLIAFDRRRAPFTLLGLEQKIYDFIELPEASVKLKIGGIIDRLEEHNGKLLIMDYKTGSSGKTYKTLEDLVTEKDKRAGHIFQTFVYASVLIRKKMFELPVVPALLYMQDASRENFSPVVEYEKEPIGDFRDLHAEFEELYIHKTSDLFNRDIPFSQTTFANNCIYCKFRELCKR